MYVPFKIVFYTYAFRGGQILPFPANRNARIPIYFAMFHI